MNPLDALNLNSLSTSESLTRKIPLEPKPCLVPASTLGLSDHPDDYILRIDNSTLERFQSCPRSSEYYVIERRTTHPTEALVAGGALHQGLEHMYRSPSLTASVPRAQEIARQWFIDHACPLSWRTPDLVCKALKNYASMYEANDPWDIVVHNDERFVEKSFEVGLGHFDLDCVLPYSKKFLTGKGDDNQLKVRRLYAVWIGKIDLLVRSVNGLYVLDHKTTSLLGSTFYKQFELGQQPLGYVWAANKIFGEMPNGFIVNVIYWRPPRKNEAMGRVEFSRNMFNYQPSVIAEWETDVMNSIADFVGNLQRGYFSGYRMWCVNKYGMCPYHEVCTLPTLAQRKVYLNTSQFEHVVWDPTKE